MKKLLLATITLLISGDIMIAQDKWQNTVSGSFGTSYNQRVSAMHVFKGMLYAGTANNTGEVYSSSTGAANSWTQVFSQTFVQSIDAINSTTEGGGYIYISGYANGSDNPRIYRSPDGLPGSWTAYYESNYDRLPFIFPFKGTGAVDSMYIVRDTYPFSRILKAAYDNNDPTNASNTFDTVLTTPSYDNIKCFAQYNNRMYVGTSNVGKIWISSADGNKWKQDTLFQPGFGNGNNTAFSAMAAYAGYLYVGTENYSDGAQIWRSNNDSSWTKLPQSFPSGRISSMNVHSGKLWITFDANGGSARGSIMKNITDTTFAFSDSVGFGLNQNHGMAGNTALFGNHIYYSCGNMDNGNPQMTTQHSKENVKSGGGSMIFAGQIWRSCTGALPAINLGTDKLVCGGVAVTFDAGPGASAYLWCNEETTRTISVDNPGDYYVTITGANGCQNTDTVTLKNKATPSAYVSMPEGPSTVCKGDTLLVDASAGSGLRVTLPALHKVTDSIIGDYKTVTDTLVVSGIYDEGAGVNLVSVTIDSLYHTDDGQLTLQLVAPDNSYITLSSNNGYGSGDYIGTTFSDTALTSVSNGTGPFTGVFYPQNSFSNFSGPSNGKWVLYVSDNSGGNTGVLKGWSLRFSEKDTNITYSWTPAFGLSSTSTPKMKITGVSSTTYILTATNAIGCTSVDSVNITVPKMKVASSSVAVCAGDSVMISATGGVSYDWSPITGLTNTAKDSIFAKPTATTKYYVLDTIATCVITDSVVVTVNPLPIVSVNSPVICAGQTATLTASGAATYSWSTSATTGSITVTPVTTTSYTVTGVTTGCSATATSSVTVNPLPTANAGTDQTACIGSTINFTNTSTGGINYKWDFGDLTTLSDTSHITNPNYIYPAAGTYTVTLTVTSSAGCTAIDNMIVTIADLPVVTTSSANATCNGTCNGTASTTTTGGFLPYTYVWSSSPSTAATATGLCFGNYTVTVTNSAGCSTTATAAIGQPTPLVPIAGASQTKCFSDTATFTGSVSGGTPGYTYLWNSGSTTYPTSTIKVVPAATTTYTLMVTDGAGCNASVTTTLIINPSTDIYGHVDTSGVNITNGKVVIYKYLPYKTHFDTIQVQPLNASGYYHFTNIDFGNYLIEVFADTLVYPRSIPTYYGDQSLWNALPSEIVNHDCATTDTFDITLINMPVLAIGTGTLSGRITKGPGFGNSPKFKGGYSPERGEPIPGIDVKLGKNPGGSAHIVEQTQTNPNGEYSFSHLPLGDEYVIFVDIPGLGRDSSYVVTPTVADSVILYLDYIADSTRIYIVDVTTGIKNSGSVAINTLSVYPNPSTDNTTIEYTLGMDANVLLGVYNVLGVKVAETANQHQSAGTYKYNLNTKKNNLNPGVYFITLIVDGKTSTRRLVITE